MTASGQAGEQAGGRRQESGVRRQDVGYKMQERWGVQATGREAVRLQCRRQDGASCRLQAAGKKSHSNHIDIAIT